VLSDDEIGGFLAEGYVAVRAAVPAPVIAACQDAIWAELGRQGARRDDPATWTVPVLRVPCPEGDAFARAGTMPVLQEACDQLVGAGRWWRRAGIGGTIPVRFPSEDDPGDAGMEWLPVAQQAARVSAHRPTVLATGRAGDVFLCHPFLVHAASWPHRGHQQRMVAQPAVALHGQYALEAEPGETPPPVQRVILDSLAATAR
jgi:hypothetical protein